MITVSTVKRVFFCLAVFCYCWQAASVSAYPLTDAQKARLEKLIPRTFAKMQKNEPIHILTLGDSVTEMFTPVPETNHNYLNAYHVKFAELLCREFFYPAGVRLLNPAKGQKDKVNSFRGGEIVIENFGVGGRTSLDALQRITTDAFLNEPDLMVIQYGINDAMMGMSSDVYRRSLQFSIDECRKRGVDVILLAPTMVRVSLGPIEWGITRGHAVMARELAAKNGVFFMDMGQVTARTSGVGEEDLDAKDAIRVVSDKIGKKFEFPGAPKEFLHPNLPAHAEMGKALYDELMNGEPPELFRIQSRATFKSPDTVEVTMTLKNGGETDQIGVLGALTSRRVLVPTEESAYQSYHLEPGKSATFTFIYKRSNTAARGNAAPRFMSLDPGESQLQFSFLSADADGSRVLDVTPVLEPVAVTWKEGQQVGVKDGVRLDWRFVNGQDRPVKGNYEINLGGRKASGKFEIQAKGQKDFFAEFPINEKDEVVRFKEEVVLRVSVGGKSFVFHREIEATRDLFLGEKMALSHTEYYTAGARGLRTVKLDKEAVYLRADADQEALYLTFDFEGIQLLKTANGVSVMVDLAIDARPAPETREFGFVDRLRIELGSADGPGVVKFSKMGLFGNGYDRLLSSSGVKTLLKTKGDASKKLEIRVPRIYLYRHPWKLGQDGQVLGLKAVVSLSAVGSDPSQPAIFTANRRWSLADSGFHFRDARSLLTLNLGKKTAGVSSWSVRLY
ncbi:MAG: hypothetical protein GXP30_15345 [Verrucomicrobia bacterium]|nr:hypothetical protein [Verrucomicrobiota bacterium]